MWYNVGMDISDWINIISAILIGGGTLFLGVMALLTIRQTRSIQKAERRERLLDEIIEWAVDMLECEAEVSTAPLQAGVTDQNVLAAFMRLSLLLKYRNVDARSEYVRQIALHFEEELQFAVKKATDELNATVEFLSEHLDTATTQKVRDYRESLELSALAVIKEATKIKTRDMGKKEENMSKEGEATGSNEPTNKDIEKHLKQQDRQTQWQWLFSLGVSAMAVGITWVLATMPRTPGDLRTGLFVFAIGLVISLLSLLYRYRKKS